MARRRRQLTGDVFDVTPVGRHDAHRVAYWGVLQTFVLVSRRFASQRFPEPPKTKLDWTSLRETVDILRYLKPYRRRFLFGLASLFIGS